MKKIKIITLKKALKDGIEGRITKDFNAQKHLEKLKSLKQKNG